MFDVELHVFLLIFAPARVSGVALNTHRQDAKSAKDHEGFDDSFRQMIHTTELDTAAPNV